MRELAKIQISGDNDVFIRHWNSISNKKIELGIITVYKDDREYYRLRELFAVFQDEFEMTLDEKVDLKYSRKELLSYEILRLLVYGNAGEGNNTYEEVYEKIFDCPRCNRSHLSQTQNLIIDSSGKGKDRFDVSLYHHDICKTTFGEILISKRFSEIIRDEKVPSILTKPVVDISKRIGYEFPYVQLIITTRIGPLIDPSPIEKKDFCNECRNYSQILLTSIPRSKNSEFYFQRGNYGGHWIINTVEEFGKPPNYHPYVVINQKFYRLMLDNKITGYSVQPAHLVD